MSERHRWVLALLIGVALGTGGCAVASVTTTGVPGEEMASAPLSADDVEDLGLRGVGRGDVAWWTREGDLEPAPRFAVVTPFTSPDLGATEIFVPQVSPAPHIPSVVARPAWSTRVDNASDTPNTTTFMDEVTVSFANPGSPGQHEGDENAERVAFSGEVEVAPGTCEDVVGLQVWQIGEPEQGTPEDVAADYLGSLVVRMPCA